MLKRISIFAILALWMMLNHASAGTKENTLTFAPLPMSNAKLNVAKSEMLVQLLSDTLGRAVVPKLYDNYSAILEAFQAGEVDFIELGPLTYLALSKQTDQLFPLASINQHPEQRHYQCVVATPIDGLQSLQSLKDSASVALTQPLSTCGWLLTEQLLEQNGINLSKLRYEYLGSHEKVALSLIRKEFTVGGLAKSVAEKYRNLGLKILVTSEPLPQFVLVGNPRTVSNDGLRQAQQAMLNFRPTHQWGLGAHGFSPVSMKLIDNLKRIQEHSSGIQNQLENAQ